jgi:hypothetical protein
MPSENVPLHGEIQQPKHTLYLTHFLLPLYSCLPTELASILLLAFSLFALVAAISHCVCSESPYLSIKLYRIYVCYMNIMLYIAFGIIGGFHVTAVGLGTYYSRILRHTCITEIYLPK